MTRSSARRTPDRGTAVLESLAPVAMDGRGVARPDARRARDRGTAVVEVLVLGVGLLVPLLYVGVSVMAVQSASYAATSAAREAARAYVTAATPAQGSSRARAAARLVLADAGVAPVVPRVRCVVGCLKPGSRVDVTVSVAVPLPLVPGGPTVTVVGEESMPVDRYRASP